MEKPLLNDKETAPVKEVLTRVLGKSYAAYEAMLERISGPRYALTTTWNYYNDGKAWLCKVSFKKKTVFWLSVWDGYFKAGFYFVERHCPGLLELEIDENIKKEFRERKPIGKLFPLALSISRSEQIADLLKVVEYKKRLK
jgi:hypothetical protein